jgi:hypothetical protein
MPGLFQKLARRGERAGFRDAGLYFFLYRNIILSHRSKRESILVWRKVLDRGGQAKTLGTVLNLGAQAYARGATQVLDRCGQAAARGAVPCASKVLGRGAEAVARGAARCASHVLDRGAQTGAQTVSCGGATLPHQEKNTCR